MKPLISVLIAHFNDTDFLLNTLYCLDKLTKNDYIVHIRDNGSTKENYERLKRETKKYSNVRITREKRLVRGSYAHGLAMNYLTKDVDTKYFCILDADATWLIKDWDVILMKYFDEKVKIIGTQVTPDSKKYKDFPLIFAAFFETEPFMKLHVDFLPDPNNPVIDTGYKLKEAYIKAGYKGKLIEMKNTRWYKEGPFNEVVCAEYYLKGEKKIFASHFGRGSLGSVAKYSKGIIKLLNATRMTRPFLNIRFNIEKKKWLRICKEITDSQV